MTSLVSVDDVRALVASTLSDDELQAVIDRVEADITERIGAPQDDALSVTITKTLAGGGEDLFFPTEILSIVSAVEHYAPNGTTTLDEEDYQIWGGGVLERLPAGFINWARRVVVTYKPADDRSRRSQAIIDLVRIALAQNAFKSESIAGEYSYTAPENWELEKRKIYKRLTFAAV